MEHIPISKFDHRLSLKVLPNAGAITDLKIIEYSSRGYLRLNVSIRRTKDHSVFARHSSRIHTFRDLMRVSVLGKSCISPDKGPLDEHQSFTTINSFHCHSLFYSVEIDLVTK